MDGTREKTLKNNPEISFVLSNARRVLSQCCTRDDVLSIEVKDLGCKFCSGAPYPCRKPKETHKSIFSSARTHDGGDGDDEVAQDGGHPPKNRLTETCSLGLPCTSLILEIHAMIN